MGDKWEIQWIGVDVVGLTLQTLLTARRPPLEVAEITPVPKQFSGEQAEDV